MCPDAGVRTRTSRTVHNLKLYIYHPSLDDGKYPYNCNGHLGRDAKPFHTDPYHTDSKSIAMLKCIICQYSHHSPICTICTISHNKNSTSLSLQGHSLPKLASPLRLSNPPTCHKKLKNPPHPRPIHPTKQLLNLFLLECSIPSNRFLQNRRLHRNIRFRTQSHFLA
jgi:hypothetical protein